MAILGNEKTLHEYMEEVDTGVTRSAFTKAFREFAPAKSLQSQVGREPIDRFFAAADEYLRSKAVGKVIDKRRMLADYKLSAKLIMGTDKKLEEIHAALERIQSKVVKRGPTRTGPIVSDILKLSALWRKRWQEKMKNDFDETLRNIRLHENLLKLFRPNKEVAEFMIDLTTIVKSRFPSMAQEDRWVLIGAAMAGAKLYTARELREAAEEKRDLIDRIRQKLVLAEKQRRKTRNDDDRIAFEMFTPITAKSKFRARKKNQGPQRKRLREISASV
jgi:hypothetical protein